MLEKTKMERIYSIQREKHDSFRKVPLTGQIIEYLGKEFIVYPTVFWPSQDSKNIVENYHISPGEEVLDVCTGSGVIAIFSALKGAKKVVALDINPLAIKSTLENAKRYHVEKVIDARVSDIFHALNKNEKFDVITMNPPFTEHKVSDNTERTTWDEDLQLHKKFFSEVINHLKKDGRIYICQAKFGAVEEMKDMAKNAGFNIKLIGQNQADEDRVFYAFELRRIES